MKGMAVGGLAQGPSRERVCKVSGRESRDKLALLNLSVVCLQGLVAMTPALTSGVDKQADRFNYNMWFSFDCSFAIPKPPSLIFFTWCCGGRSFLFFVFFHQKHSAITKKK